MSAPIQQELLEHECPEDALAADVAGLGGAYTVGVKLRPELDKKAARNWLLNCLNPDHAQNFTQSQVRLLCNLAKTKGTYHYAKFWAKDNNMSEPQPIDPEEERVKLHREVLRVAGTFEGLISRLEKLK